MESEKATKDNIKDMRENMTRLEKMFNSTKDLMKTLKKNATDDKQNRTYDKLNQRLQKDIDEFFRKKGKYDLLANEKNAIKSNPIASNGGNSITGSFAGDQDVPVMKVYDQEDFINKRQEGIKKLNQ